MTTDGKVSGITISKIRVEVVEGSLARLSLSTDGTVPAKVKRLAEHQRSKTPKARLADCNTCGGESDVQLPACPFCGDGDLEGQAPKAEPAQPLVKYTGQKRRLIPEPAPAAPIAAEDEATPVPALFGGGGIVSAVAHVLGPADLDAHVAKVDALRMDGAQTVWALGDEIGRAYNAGLWKLRQDEAGKSTYRTWNQFVGAEYRMSGAYANKLMDVAREFSPEIVKALGPTKLTVVLQVHPADRARLKAAAEQGASKVKLREMAQEVNKGKPPVATGRKPMPEGRKPVAKPKAERVTAVWADQRVEIPVYVGTGKARKRLPGLQRPATGEERMVNGIVQRVIVTKDDAGQMIVVLERVREPG